MTIDNFVIMAIIIGLTEVVKKFIVEDSKYIPVIAIVIGLVITYISSSFLNVTTWQEILLIGLVNGLSSIGLYSGVSNTINN